MVAETEGKDQKAVIAGLVGAVGELRRDLAELHELFADMLNYLNEIANERGKQMLGLIKEIYEAKLAERYNTSQIQEHFQFHSLSDKKKNIKGVLE